MPSLNQLFTRTSQALPLIGRSRSRRSSRSRNEKIRRRVLLLEKFEDRALLTAGMLDPTFGVGGKVITDMLYPKPTNTAAGTVAVSSDGKIVAAGGGGDSSFYVARYNTDGSLDSSFGVAGRQSVSSVDVVDLAIAANGSVVLVGHKDQNSSGNDFAIARLTPSGQPDLAFGVAGKQTIDFDGGDDRIYGVSIQSDGSIVVAGGTSSSPDFAVVRLTPSGQVDASFGDNGATGSILL